jgi:hypothetical protein
MEWHADIERPPWPSIVTPDGYPPARGNWGLAERAGVGDDVAVLRVVVVRFALAAHFERSTSLLQSGTTWHWEAAYGDRFLDDVLSESAWADRDGRLAELRAVDAGAVEEHAVRVEAAAHRELVPRLGETLFEADAIDYYRHLELARLAVECVTSLKRAKEIQLEAAEGRPVAVCVGDEQPGGLSGGLEVFEDRVFPDAAGRGPNGVMFRRWCPAHSNGSSRNMRNRARSASRRRDVAQAAQAVRSTQAGREFDRVIRGLPIRQE